MGRRQLRWSVLLGATLTVIPINPITTLATEIADGQVSSVANQQAAGGRVRPAKSTQTHWVHDRSKPVSTVVVTQNDAPSGAAAVVSDGATGITELTPTPVDAAPDAEVSMTPPAEPAPLAEKSVGSGVEMVPTEATSVASTDGCCATPTENCEASVSTGCSPTACDGCSGGCQSCQPASPSLCCCNRFWIRTEYLMWWVDGQNVPPLVTSSPGNVPVNDAGVLGLPTTSVLYGGEEVSEGLRSGGRLSFGYWFDDSCCFGLTGQLWGLGHDDGDFLASSDGDPVLARPFFNVDPTVNANDAQIVAYPNLLAGQVAVDTSSELYSGNLMLRGNLGCITDSRTGVSERLSLLGGYRFFRFNEGLGIQEDLVVTANGGLVAQGTTFNVRDSFRTQNEFHGSEFGLNYERRRGLWTLDMLGAVAVGNMSRQVVIDGSTTTTVPNVAPTTRTGGLLAQSTNIGQYEDSETVAIPQFQATLGRQLNRNWQATIGYTFIYVGEVARAADQIDTSVNGNLLDPNLPLVGPSRPVLSEIADSDMWITGLSFGMQYRY